MPFEFLDYVVIAGYLLILILIAVISKRRGQESLDDYFAGGKNLPWWLVGVSMVATTFAADTPLAITGIVASEGLAGNWFWWSWMISGMITVFVYARLWKRADVLTDCEFIELRYGGKPASFLRGFRALYFAFPFNCVIMGWVTVGMAKVMTVITGADQWVIITILYGITAVYIAISGLWGVVVTDFIQFFLAMAGAIALAWFAVDEVGGMQQLQLRLADLGNEQLLSLNPFTNPEIPVITALIWVGMAWWAAWYPGAEPGGGGYIAQRMFSARDERNAVAGTLLFNIANYAIRPWPWIIVALVSLVMFPDLTDKEAGYPMMMAQVLPVGWFGLMCVAFLSAFVSTISTQLNWGTSYVINDFYARFIRTRDSFGDDREAQRHYVFISRIATLAMAAIAIVVSYFFDSVKGGWEFILSLSAGIGGVMLLRWFWWRINAWSEISAMIAAAAGAFISVMMDLDFAGTMIFTTTFSTSIWILVTFLTKPEAETTLRRYARQVRPSGKAWEQYMESGKTPDKLASGLFQAGIAVISLIFILYGMQQFFFGDMITAVATLSMGVGGCVLVIRTI